MAVIYFEFHAQPNQRINLTSLRYEGYAYRYTIN